MMDVDESLDRKFKEARTKNNITTSRTANEVRPNVTRVRDASIDFHNIISQQNQREVFLNMMEFGKLPPARPMCKESTNIRKNGKYCEYHKDVGYTTANCKNLASVISQIIEDKGTKEILGLPKVNQEFLIENNYICDHGRRKQPR